MQLNVTPRHREQHTPCHTYPHAEVVPLHRKKGRLDFSAKIDSVQSYEGGTKGNMALGAPPLAEKGPRLILTTLKGTKNKTQLCVIAR